jgi:hypothetical protein
MIGYLIEPDLNIKRVRDRLVEILLIERESQKSKAQVAGRNPLLYDFRVFGQQRDPIDCYAHAPQNGTPDALPIVNIAVIGETLSEKAPKRELISPYAAEYLVTVFGYGTAQSETVGHSSAADVALAEAERTIGLVRAILLAGDYRWPLKDDRKHIRSRWVKSLTYDAPTIDEGTTFAVQTINMSLMVDLDEVVRQVDGIELELVTVNVRREDNGELFLLQVAVDTTES